MNRRETQIKRNNPIMQHGSTICRLVCFLICVQLHSLTVPTAFAQRLFVSNEKSNDVSVIDVSSAEQPRAMATIPVGKRPRGIQISPDGQRVYVALSGSVIAGPGAGPTDRSGKDAPTMS